MLDGGEFCSVAKNINLLVIARGLLFVENPEANDHVMNSLAVKWWRLRLLWVHQKVLDEKSEVIFKSAKELHENINLDCLNDEG